MTAMTGRTPRSFTGFLAMALLGLHLSAGLAAAQEKKESPVTSFLQNLKLGGYIQAYGASWDPGTDTFQLPRARLVLNGAIVKDLSFKVSLDLAKSVGLLDAQIEFTPFREAGLRFGQFLVPFSLDSVTSAADVDMVNRPAVVDALAPSRDIGSSGRDAGIAAFGRWSIAEYALGLFNGSGLNKADEDGHKDFSGRLVLRPAKFLAVGGSLYRGERSPAEGEPLADRNKEGLEAQFALDRILVKGEYIHARDGLVSKAGWYATAGVYALPGKVQALVRYDALDLDRAVANDGTHIVTFGVSWFIAGRTKLQVNYEIHGLQGVGREKSGLLAQFQAAL
jgi:phosphate-selective porin OprO and OprP